MSEARHASATLAAFLLAGLLILTAACGDSDEAEDQEKSSGRTSSTLVRPEGGPKGGYSGPVAVAGYDPTTDLLVVVRGGSPATEPFLVDDETLITVQGPDGPERLPVSELASWLADRIAGLPEGAKEVPMEVEAEGDGTALHVTALAEVPPG